MLQLFGTMETLKGSSLSSSSGSIINLQEQSGKVICLQQKLCDILCILSQYVLNIINRTPIPVLHPVVVEDHLIQDLIVKLLRIIYVQMIQTILHKRSNIMLSIYVHVLYLALFSK